jgi:hypothetical protein
MRERERERERGGGGGGTARAPCRRSELEMIMSGVGLCGELPSARASSSPCGVNGESKNLCVSIGAVLTSEAWEG